MTPELAGRFAAIALGHVAREYPNKLDHVLAGPQDAQGPRALHPIFFGSFDWHSCVHGYWLLAHLLRRFPAIPSAPRIAALLDASLTADNAAGERAYLAQPSSRGFERPYGWAWLLRLQAELLRDDTAAGRRRAAALAPLAQDFARRFMEFLPRATYPVRAGTHGNTAFALLLALDYAGVAGDSGLSELAMERARAWYGADADCQAWEPCGDDFLSPALIEAALMQAVLPPADFAGWFTRFLPRLGQGEPATLFIPARVSDRSDGKIAHLDGLNLSRAWCWRLIAQAVPPGDARLPVIAAAQSTHLGAALDHISGDYMGEHWLATYAALALG